MVDFARFIEMFLLGSAGAFSLEIIKAYELRGKLHHKRYRDLLRSPFFWVVAALFILVSGFVAWAFNEGNPSASPAHLVASGMGASALAKKISEAAASSTRVDAGDPELGFTDIFR